MGDYNPRQITQMRWKDAKELEKFKFISGEFSFTNNVVEQASKHKPWSKIVEVIENGSAYKPILIFDIRNNEFYFGTQENNVLYLQTLYANQGYTLEIDYDHTTDKLTITSTEYNYLTDSDAPKMYRHELNFKGNDSSVTITLTYYSSNELPVNSAQDLTNITKAVNNETFIACTGFEDAGTIAKGNGIYFQNNIWKFGYYYYGQGAAQFDNLCNLDEFYDNVTTI